MRRLCTSLASGLVLIIGLAVGAVAQPEGSIEIDAPWADAIVDIGSLPDGGSVIVTHGTPGIVWSADGTERLDADPGRRATPCDPRYPVATDESLVAVAGDRVLLLDRATPAVWVGDPAAGAWQPMRHDGSELSDSTETLTIAASDREALVGARVPSSVPAADGEEPMVEHEYVAWVVDPVSGSAQRHPLPVPAAHDHGSAIAVRFDGRWLLAATDPGTGSLLESADGASWTQLPWPEGWGSLTSMSSGDESIFVTTCHFGGDSFWRSTDGRTWTQVPSTRAGHHSAYVQGLGFVVPYADGITILPDGPGVGRLVPNPAGGADHVAAAADRLLIATGERPALVPLTMPPVAADGHHVIERAPLASIDPSLVPDADGFIYEDVAPGVR